MAKKEIEAAEGLEEFFNQFGKGNSIYKRVVLEVFLEELLGVKNLSISGQEGQEGREGGGYVECPGEDQSDETSQHECPENPPEHTG